MSRLKSLELKRYQQKGLVLMVRVIIGDRSVKFATNHVKELTGFCREQHTIRHQMRLVK